MNYLFDFRIDSKEVQEIMKKDLRLAKLINMIGDLKIQLPSDHFRSLCRNIVGQQLSVKAAATIWKRFQEGCGELSPEGILAMKEEALRAFGLSRSKVVYIKDLCHKIIDQEIILTEFNQLTDQEVISNLTKVKGIGKWTAEMFLIFSLGRLDVFAMEDLGLKRAVKWIYDLEELPKKKALEEYSQIWMPHRTIASLYLWEGINQKIIP
ncbi:DNA-3-methyladenine glycosylase family protein [Alkaliphilus transvaalensis]|uniref:DNA-3-methyladenine glycosylase family protein n=1 Tax=Alkaliphilus transvaalensis TaxID=114628 RepID=UPI000B26A6FA|nr:DNA-3-methyladenine glycosylase 2 family protein [Alkaliphilus transvaalensis]